MTASLFSFLGIDGNVVEINSDRIDYMVPYNYSLPTGVAVGTKITVDQIDILVQNSLTGINSVLPSTTVPQTLPSGVIPVYPAVLGSSQTDPFRLIERKYWELSTMFNSPDGMPWRLFRAAEITLPPWLGGANAPGGNFGWANTNTALPPPPPQTIDQFWYQPPSYLGDDVLPFRLNTDLPGQGSMLFDTNNYSFNLSIGIP